ncbi:MAG: NUDIX hydrolase [Chloroflexi bacterium]|nr:NUDIX hydrolase [Chloroflexota bacterium]|tara:strand:+ start:916 stop:1509 length:594 start_codon:yes stop_codon:yes gene_type:complete
MTNIQPVPAATVVLARESEVHPDIEILLLKRNSRLVFHGGHWVFPGGRIDAKDFKRSRGDLEYPAALKAAVRETREEAGIEISEEHLIHTAHWTTPPKQPRRFSTWFFVCPLYEHVSVRVDNDEILEHRWITPVKALAEADAESLVLPRPTRVTLQDIALHQTLKELVAAATEGNIRVFPKDSKHYHPVKMGYSPSG